MSEYGDVYRFILKHEKLNDDKIVSLLKEKFWMSKLSGGQWADTLEVTRQSRPKVIRMGNVPTTNWCKKG